MSVRRLWLIPLLVCVLGAAFLVAPTTSTHAQMHTQHVSSQQMVVNDNGGTYFFNAGWWGWGMCLSHNTLQGLYTWSATRLVVSATASGKVDDWRIQAAGVMLWIYLGSLKMQDRGGGICIAWPYYIPSTIPIAWAQ